MEHTTGSFTTQDGLRLFTRTWTPGADPVGVVALAHGIGEHSGRYAHVASRLMLEGFAVEGYDHRGHGQSQGPRAYVDDFAELTGDLGAFTQRVRARHPDLPLFLMGHSLGGLIAATWVAEAQPELDGLVLSSPALKVPDDLSPLLQKVSGLTARWVPRLPTVKIDINDLSRNPAVVRAFEEDPLNDHKGVRASMGHQILEASRAIQTQADRFHLPLYLFHGTADRITDPQGTVQFYHAAPSSDKTLELYEGFYHETFNEDERERVLDDLAGWLVAHA